MNYQKFYEIVNRDDPHDSVLSKQVLFLLHVKRKTIKEVWELGKSGELKCFEDDISL